MNDNLKNFQFTCTQEKDRFPPFDPEADMWFKEARSLEKQKGKKDYVKIGSLYRQAAMKSHVKAIGNLQALIAAGDVAPAQGQFRQQEVIELVERLIKMGIPFGYFIMGTYLQQGYGVEQDSEAAFQYMLKAAVMGNPDGQYVIGDKFLYRNTPSFRLDLGRSMLACAAEQGYAKAAYELALDYKNEDNNKSLYYFQLSTKYGYEKSAYKLAKIFNTNDPNNQLDYLGQKIDPERVKRYQKIYDELDKNPYAKFPDINKIVPLPPAELPEWDGTFEYKKQVEGQ
ncbi:sel1 repeat family protein [Providencia stuartii]|uniref:Sel1 repeat family protein n=1 Tax=Providencia stuartii TaxID=588 RepID=A0AAI9I0R2_PROST|nr:sel1 repeat family protein [Providencia stuartii]EMD5260621.1 sel1 repeat family protein [Providencia stuartii]